MPDVTELTPGQVLADASVADFISQLGLGIANAQRALDENSLNQLGEFLQPREGLGGRSLAQLGLLPAFYHYQHADISCALQISLRVARAESFGLNLNFNLNNTSGNTSNNSSSSNNTSSTSSTESGSSSSRSTRSATLTIRSSTTGALTVAGQNFTLAGADPAQRIRALADALRGNAATGVQRVAVTPPTQAVNPSVVPPHAQVVASPNAVAFMTGDPHSGLIEVEVVPAAPETFQVKAGVTVTTELRPDIQAYAQGLSDRIRALGYATEVWGSGFRNGHANFDWDSAEIRATPDAVRLRRVARMMRATGAVVKVFGYTDRSGSNEYNVGLGNRRVQSTIAFLRAQGVAANQLLAQPSTGEQRWAGEGVADGTREERMRLVELILEDSPKRYVYVLGDASHTVSPVLPDHTSGPTPGNGWVYVGDGSNTNLTTGGRKVVIDNAGQHGEFPLSGAAINGAPTHSGEAYAQHLAIDINANTTLGVRAWAVGHVCNMALAGDNFQLSLLTTEDREISLTGTDDVTVTQQFSRSSSTSSTDTGNQATTSSGNTTVAVGAAVDLRFSRQFEQNVTGNSAISARLVSIPAPPEFLALVRDFLRP